GAQVPLPQDGGERRQRHGPPRMAAIRLLDGIHRERADGVDAELVEGGVGRGHDIGHAGAPLTAGLTWPPPRAAAADRTRLPASPPVVGWGSPSARASTPRRSCASLWSPSS